MANTAQPELNTSGELLAELHRRLEAHRASPEDSESWEIADKRVFGDD